MPETSECSNGNAGDLRPFPARHSDLDHAHAIKSVWYVTMAYPVPSEAFASVEINELRRRQIDVSVKSIRTKRRDSDIVTAQQQVQQVPLQHASWRSPLRGGVFAALHPWLAIRLWWKLTTTLVSRPLVLAACLFWSLRCFDLLASVRREKPDVVHLYWGHVPAMLGWLVLKSIPEQVLTIGLGAYDLQMAIPLSFEVADQCSGVRTWAKENIDAIQSQGVSSERVQLIHKGISIERFACQFSAKKKTSRIGRLIFAGRLIPEKGVELVVKIVCRLKTAFPDIELVVVGDGPLYRTLLRQIDEEGLHNHVHLRGHLSHAELASELQSAQLFLLPSRHDAERLPNVIKEAAAAGCCCLTTSTPGIDLLVRDGESGRVLPANDIQAWVDAIAELLRAPELALRMAAEAKRRVLKHFDIERTADELVEWWQRLSAESRRAKRGST